MNLKTPFPRRGIQDELFDIRGTSPGVVVCITSRKPTRSSSELKTDRQTGNSRRGEQNLITHDKESRTSVIVSAETLQYVASQFLLLRENERVIIASGSQKGK